ncbi:MAG: carboxypeptidase regulatory-like domain-containing protein [Thermodesulfovibrionales bacterium]|nr:carboxypeptidase regulatory-like domain-containing protein [Thermodesulfovibrionales bacterium]
MDTCTMNRRAGMKILLSLFFVLTVMLQVSSAAVVDVYLRADTFTVTMPDGQMITMWGFVQTDNTYTPLPGQLPSVPGPQINALAGDTVNLHVQNNLTGLYTEPVSIHIPGQIAVMTPTWTDGSSGNRISVTQRVRSFAHEAAQGGGTATYTWNNIKAGTYLYQSATHPSVQIQMGLFGVLEVNAAAGPPLQAYPAISYDIDLTLVFSEIDPVIHTAVAAGTYGANPTSTIHYNPKYFLINGKPFTYGESAIPIGTPTQTTLLRFLNAGLDDHVPVFQGFYVKIIAEDGKLYPYQKDQYSLHLSAGKTADVLISAPSAGYYPLYDRRLYLTNAAASPGGMFRYLMVQSATQYLLTVNLAGTGTGKVELVSIPGGINCGMGNVDCTELINDGTSVVLSATAAAVSSFAGWSGDCTGLGTCTLTMNAAKSVTATFTGGIGASISGTVATAGGTPIAGVTMTLTGAANATATTDASGNYSFAGLTNGAYTVTPSLAGYTFSPVNRAVTISNANVTGQNFTGSPLTYLISGTVATAGGTPIAGVTMTLTGAANATATTDASGNYSFAGLTNGAYTVTPSLTGYSFTPINRNVTISNANVTNQNFTGTAAATYFIRGYVKDSNGRLMSGVTMRLTGAATMTMLTDALGNYQFSGLLPGTYTVNPSKTGYVFSPLSRTVTITNQNITGQEFEGKISSTP